MLFIDCGVAIFSSTSDNYAFAKVFSICGDN